MDSHKRVIPQYIKYSKERVRHVSKKRKNLDTIFTPIEHYDVYRKVLTAVAEKRPFCLLRYGDGENMFVKGFADKQDNNVARYNAAISILKHHFGYDVTLKEMAPAFRDFIDAYRDADIIGIPNKENYQRNHNWDPSLRELRKHDVIKGQTFCHMYIHKAMLKDNFFEFLLRDANDVYLIDSRDVGDALKRKYNVRTVHEQHITPEYYGTVKGNRVVKSYALSNDIVRHFPTQYHETKEWIDSFGNLDGGVFLVGAGVLGKAYCGWVKNNGGVAIDIGSVFDTWAGLQTRRGSGGEKFINNHRLA